MSIGSLRVIFALGGAVWFGKISPLPLPKNSSINGQKKEKKLANDLEHREKRLRKKRRKRE